MTSFPDEVTLLALPHNPAFQVIESSSELTDETLRAMLWSDLTCWDRCHWPFLISEAGLLLLHLLVTYQLQTSSSGFSNS